MDTKQQAINQAISNFEKIQQGITPPKSPTYFQDYFSKGFNLGRFQEKEDWGKPVAQFTNFLAQAVEDVISSPSTIYQGGVDITKGRYYSGTGKILKGGLDLSSIIPVGRAAKVGTTAVKGLETSLGKSVLKEAGIAGGFGTAYGVAEGLIQAQDLPEEQRLGKILTEAGIQGGVGAGIGASIPLIGTALGKSWRYLNKERVPSLGTKSPLADDFAKSVDDFKIKLETPTIAPLKTEATGVIEKSIANAPKTKSEVKSLKIKPTAPKTIITEDVSSQTSRVGKKAVDDAIFSKKIQSTSKTVRQKASNILDNLIVGNNGGAAAIIKNTTEKERRRTYKFLKSLYDKGGLPEEYRVVLNDAIKNDFGTTYVQRNSGEAFQVARQRITNSNYSQKVEFAKEIIDLIKRKENQLKDAGVAEVSWPREKLGELITQFPQKGDNQTVIEDYLNALAFDLAAKGDSSLAKELEKITAGIYTSTGQISQGATNSLQVITRKTEDLFDNIRSVTDNKSYQVVKDAARSINDEFTAVNNQVVNDPALQESLFNLQDFFNQNIAEALGIKIPKKELKDEQIIANAWKKSIDSLVPNADKKEGEKLSESILQSILVGKAELQEKGIKPKVNAEEALYQRLKYSFDNIDEISNKVELAKNELRVLISQDPNKLQIAQSIFDRMIPEVYVTNQADKMYSYLVRDLKPNFRELVKNPEEYRKFREKFTEEFFKRVPVDKNKASQMTQLLRNKLDAKYEAVKKTVKLPGQIVAERVIKSAERAVQTPSEQLEKDVNTMLVNLSYQIYKKEMKIPTIASEQVKNNITKDMYSKWRIMLENPTKFRNVLLEAQEIIRESFPSRVPEVDSILENYMGRLYGDVWTASDITKAAQDQLKKNNVSIVDLVKKHTSIQGATFDDLKSSFINDLGVSSDIAEGMARQFTELINVKADSTRRQLVNRILAPVIPQQKERASATQKILEYANLGIFDDVKTSNVLAEKLRLPHLSESDSKFIANRLSEAQTNPNFTYDDAIKAIGMKLAESNPVTFRNSRGRQILFDQYYYNNIFSGFQTQLRNIWGGFANGIVYRNATLLGEYTAAKLLNSGLLPKRLRPANVQDLTKDIRFKDILEYNKAYFGSIKQAADNFSRVYTDPYYVPASEAPDINYYFREYQKKQLTPALRQVANFMEATDQFLGTLAEAGELAVNKKRGMTDKEAAANAFLLRQEILGRSEFKPYKKGEVGLVDALFDKIGNLGTQIKGRDTGWNYLTTPLFPVLRLAVNFQKIKARLFPPTQLINILTKTPENRKLIDYAYLSVGTATSAFAIQKYLNNEIAFEAPKTEAEKKLFYDSGRKPYSVKIGDSWVPFSYLELFAAPFMYMGAMRAAFQDDPEALTEGDLTKLYNAQLKFIKAFFISPTYLQVVSKILSSGDGYQKDPIASTAEFAGTGFVPFVGLLKDIVDVVDPIKRKKQDTWDEFKALVPDLTIGQYEFKPGFRSSLEPYTTTDLQPTPLTTSELYAPYGIGTTNPRFDKLYQDSVSTKQEQKLIREKLKPETERITKSQDELELAILQGDYKKQAELARTLTTEQINTVKGRMKQRYLSETLTPQERALYGLSSDQLNTLGNIDPSTRANISKVNTLKDRLEIPQENLFDSLNRLATNYKAPTLPKGKKPKKLKVKKVSKKKAPAPKKQAIKPIKVKKLTALKKLPKAKSLKV